jgi:hypothetical protein
LLATLAVDRAELFRDRSSWFALLATLVVDRAELFGLRRSKFALLATNFPDRAEQGAAHGSYLSVELADSRHVLAVCFHALLYGRMRPVEFRDTLFGDVPLSSWVPEPRPSLEPWATFAQARDALAAGRTSDAVDRLQAVAAMPTLESRHYLQAWHVLRELGARPASEIAKGVYGVVVEVSLQNGLDVLAAYADRRARYLNWSGGAVIWDAPDPRFDADIAAVLDAGNVIAQRIGPWEGPRRGPPPTGHVRLNLLTPSGLLFGEGPMDILARDALAAPLLAAATGLMRGLASLPRQQTPGAPAR